MVIAASPRPSILSFNLMIASGEIPDIVGGNRLKDGFNQYGQEGAFLPLNDLIDEHAPNIKAFFEERPEIKAAISAADHQLPVIVEVPHPRAVNSDTAQIETAAAYLGHDVEVGVSTDSRGVRYLLSPRPLTAEEEGKKQLQNMGFATYAAYVRDCSKKGPIFHVGHMGQTDRRQVHANIRYALKPLDVSLSKINSSMTRVTIL